MERGRLLVDLLALYAGFLFGHSGHLVAGSYLLKGLGDIRRKRLTSAETQQGQNAWAGMTTLSRGGMRSKVRRVFGCG